MFEYKARVLRILDADTLWLNVDCGFDLALRMTVRLAGLDAPEKRTPEGSVATSFVRAWLAANPDFTLRTEKDSREKFGRYLGVLVSSTGESLNDALIASGNAVPYDGGRRA